MTLVLRRLGSTAGEHRPRSTGSGSAQVQVRGGRYERELVTRVSRDGGGRVAWQ